jgi:trigger factor
VSVDEFEHGLDHAFTHVQKDVELKGFRKGHVPRNIYETKFGVESLYEEALNHVFHHKYHDAVADETIRSLDNLKLI